MNRSIYKYLFFQLIAALGFVTALLVSTIWLVTALRFIDYIVNRGLPLTSFLALVALTLPGLLNVALPLAVFAAVLFVHQRLAHDNEIVVMRAAGVGPLMLATPAIALGLVGAVVTYAMSLYLMPAGQRAFKDWQNDIRDNYAQVALQEGAFNRLGPGLTVFLRERVADGELRGLLIHNATDPQNPETLLAERGVITAGEFGPRVLLVKGSRQVLNRESGRLQFLSFDRYVFEPKTESGPVGRRFRERNERFLHELFWPPDPVVEDRQRNDFWAEGHARLTKPLLALSFALVAAAATLSGEHSRRRSIRKPLIATVVIASASALLITSQNIASDGVRAGAIPLYIVPIGLMLGALLQMRLGPRAKTARAAA